MKHLYPVGIVLLGVCAGLFAYQSIASAPYAVYPDTPGVAQMNMPDGDLFHQERKEKDALSAAQLPLGSVEVVHIDTPDSVRALYMSSWVAGTPSIRNRVIKTIESEGLNAVVIDIKDATGKVSFMGISGLVGQYNSYSTRVRDMAKFIRELHEKGIYVIGRVAVFQDPLAAEYDPSTAVQTASGDIWVDRNKLSWVDPSSEAHWKYIASIARESYSIGFDEINLDYVRFPTDGNMSDIRYPLSGDTPKKAAIITKFFAYMDTEVRKGSGIPLSADVFGLATTVPDTHDVGIGQNWIALLPYVDALCPMIYPSHYATNSFGYTNPADHPYEIISAAVKGAIAKNATLGESIEKIRPWIQDFDMGANYDAEKVRAQIKALSDLGVDSYLSWDPANTYTKGGYKEQ
jgi:hypothetical protein